jgi:hypothetical protein
MDPIYSIYEAWKILGKDAKQIIRIAMNYPSLDERIKVIDEILVRARKIAKKLSAQHHPDVNPNDPDAERKFKDVQLALKSIEYHTNQFKINAAQVKLETENKRSSRTVICVIN